MALIKIIIEDIAPIVVNNLSAFEIGKLKQKYDSEKISYGLTRVELKTKPNFSLEATGVKSKISNKIQFYYENLTINLSFNWIKIWIAKELNINTCPYNAVLVHERKHASIATSILRTCVYPIQDQLNQLNLPEKSNPLIIDSTPESFNANCIKYEEYFRSEFKKFYLNKEKLQEFYDNIATAWKKFDSPEEYSRVKAWCKENEWPL